MARQTQMNISHSEKKRKHIEIGLRRPLFDSHKILIKFEYFDKTFYFFVSAHRRLALHVLVFLLLDLE